MTSQPAPEKTTAWSCWTAILLRVYRNSAINTKTKTKILARLLAGPRLAVRLQRNLEKVGLEAVAACHPRLFEKYSRPYLAKGLSARERVDLVCGHYTALASHFQQPAVMAMYTKGIRLLTPLLAELDAYVELSYQPAMEKEGELSLNLFLHGERAYTATFLLGRDTLYIGSLQGSKSSLVEIRRFTKASHGVRPQNFVLFVLRQFAGHLGISSIKAIGNAAHVYTTHRRTKDRISFDYDTFWAETGGQRLDERFYDLPLLTPRKEIANVVMNKRAQYRRRYEFLDACAALLDEELGVLRP